MTTTFDELADTYFSYAVNQQRRRSWPRDLTSIRALKTYFGGKRLTDITPALIEQYRTQRRQTISRRGRPITTASINRELGCLKRMFNVGLRGLIVLKGGVPRENPVASVSLGRENNTRDRVLGREGFDQLLGVAPTHLRPILVMAYHTGMQESESLRLTWDRVDLKAEVIRLPPEDTKTQDWRIIPLTKGLSETLKNATIYLDKAGQRVPSVFTYAGKPIGSVRRAFDIACREAGITDMVFHDLRHTFVTDMRRAGVDYFRIMAITGHKTMSAFKRYHTIDHQDLHHAIGQLDTYLDTSAADSKKTSSKYLNS